MSPVVQMPLEAGLVPWTVRTRRPSTLSACNRLVRGDVTGRGEGREGGRASDSRHQTKVKVYLPVPQQSCL